MRTTLILGMYLAFAPLGLAQQGPFTIRRGQVGPVAIGASAQVIYGMFPADRRRLVDLQLEGELTPALELTLPGSGQRGGVVAELAARNQLEVSRIWITDPAVRTEKGIGVGSAVTDLRAAYRLAWISAAEGRVYLRAEELGASFQLDRTGSRGEELDLIGDPSKVPGEIKIIGILLAG